MRKNKDLMADTAREKQRFSIRKLTIGATSVLLGTFLFWGSASTVKADNPSANSQQPSTAVENNQNGKIKTDNNTGSAENNKDKQVVAADKQTEQNKSSNSGSQTSQTTTPSTKVVTKANNSSQQDKELTVDQNELKQLKEKNVSPFISLRKEEGKAVSTNDFTVSNVSGIAVDSNGADGKSSYENLKFDLNIPNTKLINDGDYITIQWGISYTDQDGTTKIKPYDKTRASAKNITYQDQVIGTLAPDSETSGYRITFNKNLQKFDNVTLSSQNLQWSTSKDQASAHKVLIYEYTDSPSLNGAGFTTTIPGDVDFNGKTKDSNLTVDAEVVYNGELNQTANTKNQIGTGTNIQRFWSSDGTKLLTNSTYWFNTIQYQADLAKTGNDFTITINVPNNHYWKYDWVSESDLINQIKNAVAGNYKKVLSSKISNQVTGVAGSLYLDCENTGTTSSLDPGKITVTRTINDSWQDSSRNNVESYHVTYHVTIQNKNVRLAQSLTLGTVSHDGFTLPTNITNYDQDIAAADIEKTKNPTNFGAGFNYQSAVTSNSTLMNSLENTDPVYATVINNNTGQNTLEIQYYQNGTEITDKYGNPVRNSGAPWIAVVKQADSSSADSGIDVTDQVAAHLTFKDEDNLTKSFDKEYIAQDKTGSQINFSQYDGTLDTYLPSLLNNGYTLDKVVLLSPDGKSTTEITSSDNNKGLLSKYDFGKFNNTEDSNSTNQMEFVVYLKEKVTTNIHYIDVGRTDKTSGFTPSDGTEVDNGSHDVKNIGGNLNTNYDVTKDLWSSKDYEAEGYVLAEEPANVGKGTFTSGMSDQYIYLKHKITNQVNDTSTVTEIIKYKYQNGVEAFPTHRTSIQFKATSGKHDVHDNVDFDLVWTPTSSQFKQVVIPTINNYSFIASNDDDPAQDVTVTNGSVSYIKSFSNIEHNSNDINLTVVYNIISEKAHLVFYDDSTDQFITKNNGTYSETSDPSNAYEDSTVDNSTAGENISFGAASSVLATLLGNNYKYEYVGISKENQNNISKVTAKTEVDKKTAFKDYKFGKLDNDENTDQYFIVHLKKIDSKPSSQTNTVKETIKFVDENNNSIHDPVTNGTITFTQTNGNWDKESDSFKTYLIPTTIGNYVFDHTLAAKTSDGKSLASVTVTHSSKDIVLTLVYKLKSSDHQKTTPPTPDNPQPKTQPTAQTQPTSPTQPTQNSQDKTPKTPKKPTTPKKPAKPGKTNKPQTHKNHHKNPWNHNNGVHGENTPNGRRRNNWNQNYGPHSEYGYNGNYRPQGQNGYYGNSSVNGENVTNSSVHGENANAVNSNSKKQATLPQTGEKQTNYGLIGLVFAAIAGLFALAGGEHKRRHN